MDFKNSKTRINLMRAFAGESQARNRYVFAASKAKKDGLYVISAIFAFTAAQEKEHAEIFYHHLEELAGSSISVDGSYPVDLSDDGIPVVIEQQAADLVQAGQVYCFRRVVEDLNAPPSLVGFLRREGEDEFPLVPLTVHAGQGAGLEHPLLIPRRFPRLLRGCFRRPLFQ